MPVHNPWFFNAKLLYQLVEPYPIIALALASLVEESAARVSPAAIERLYHGTIRTSVSQLETYAACPFQHFARYILRR